MGVSAPSGKSWIRHRTKSKINLGAYGGTGVTIIWIMPSYVDSSAVAESLDDASQNRKSYLT